MRRLAASLLGLIALGACSAPPPQHAAVTTPSSSGSPLTTASQARTPGPSPVASPSPDLPVTAVGFTCRLPVMFNQHEFEFTGGFISFPSAAYQADPNGALSGSPDNTYTTAASPVLHGAGGWPFYDLAMRRWLPTGPGQTSPDGRSYAYIVPIPASNPTVVHVVQVATGSDHVISIGLPPGGVGWQLEDFNGSAVFLAGQMADPYPVGVWRLDVASGSLHKLTPAGHVLLVQNGTAWIGLNNPADPSPPLLQIGEAFDSIAAVNLSTGAQTTWMYEPGMSVQVLAVDEFGRLVAGVAAPPDFTATSIVFVQTPGSPGDVVTANGTGLFLVEPDRGQLWFGSGRGIYFWTSVTGFKKVYAIQEETSGPGQAIVPAGHCV